MRILVFGAGALGSVLGALLSGAHDVALVTRGEHLEKLRQNGLILEGIVEGNFHLRASDIPNEHEKFDLIIVTTKSYDTETAASACEKIVSDESAVLSVQNGLGNIEKLILSVGTERVTAGITSMAAYRQQPGIVKYVAEGDIILGSLSSDSRAVTIAENALSEAGIVTKRTNNIEGALWSKAIVNAVINPLTAVLGCRNGAIAEDELLKSLAEMICSEGMKTAKAKGVELDPPDAWGYVIEVARRTAENRSSMLMDIREGRSTEIDAICGNILSIASEEDVETPFISCLYSMIKFLETSGMSQKA